MFHDFFNLSYFQLIVLLALLEKILNRSAVSGVKTQSQWMHLHVEPERCDNTFRIHRHWGLK